jgi:hypothetical protein
MNQRRKQRLELKKEKKQAKAENVRSKAQSRIILANQGIVQPTAASAIGQSIAGLASTVTSLAGGGIANVLSGASGGSQANNATIGDQISSAPPVLTGSTASKSIGQSADQNSEQAVYTPPQNDYKPAVDPNAPDPKKDGKNKNMPYIIGAVVIAIILIILLIRK